MAGLPTSQGAACAEGGVSRTYRAAAYVRGSPADRLSDVTDPPTDGPPPVTRRPVGQPESARAQRSWWDAEAAGYLAEHGAFLGTAGFVWGPEGLTEDDAHLLGEVAGRRVLEVGAGAGQCSRW